MLLRFALLAGLMLPGSVFAQEKKPDATTPSPRDAKWVMRHEGFVAEAKKGGVDVVLLGDSITDGWDGAAALPLYKKFWEPLKTLNLGIGGDRTQHVLWRIQNGELEGINPKVVMLMIGTNNSGQDSAKDIAAGVTAIVKTIQEKKPATKIMLLGVFPRGEKADNAQRVKLIEVNKMISKLDDGKQVRYLDIGAKFLQPDGVLTKDIMPDFLHLSARGYEIWAEAVTPLLKELMK